MTITTFTTEPAMTDPDGFYERLIEAHVGLDDATSERLNAALVLVMANQIGNPDVLARCVDAARQAVVPTSPDRRDAPDATA